jgi:phosphoglucomutase
MAIKFGTSGWRAIIADEFTFAGVRRVTAAIAQYLRETGQADKGVVVSHDTRFFADRFAWAAADELLDQGFTVRLTDRDTPTPVVAYSIITGNHGGAINLTASHNPPQYCGLKFNDYRGANASTEVTNRIEELLNSDSLVVRGENTVELEDLLKRDGIEVFSPKQIYLAQLEKLVDTKVIRDNPLRVVVDCLYGTCRGYLAEILLDLGCEVEVIHAHRDAYFGGHTPEPSGASVEELCQAVKKSDAVIGLACDGDADRFGIVDSTGHYVDANMIFALVFWHLAKVKGWSGGVARSVATTQLIDALARKLDRPVHQTPVGIKWLAEWVLKGDVVGGEESAGVCFRGHVPDKDGILVNLLIVEMMARSGKNVRQLIEDLYIEVGRKYLHGRLNLRLTEELAPIVRARLQEEPPKTFAGVAIRRVDRTDGLKLELADDCWAMLRPSGTEPKIRIYCEAHDDDRLNELIAAAKVFLLEGKV